MRKAAAGCVSEEARERERERELLFRLYYFIGIRACLIAEMFRAGNRANTFAANNRSLR